MLFSQDLIKAISKVLGDTFEGFSGSEISHLLKQAKIPDIVPGATKWIRLHDAFCAKQNKVRNRTNILEFIRQAMKPANFIDAREKHQKLRSRLNTVLAFDGIELTETGELVACKKISTLEEAEVRANQIKLRLQERDIHPEVLKFCRAELLKDNYFHAVLEAVKSVFDKLRNLINSKEDGYTLVDKCFSGEAPRLKINSFITESEISEQRGFVNLLKGTYSMFRSPAAHEAKINWKIEQRDAEDLLTLVSMFHRRIDMLATYRDK